MLSDILKYLKFANDYCAIAHTSVDGKSVLNGLVIKKKKDTFDIDKTFTVDAIEGVPQYLEKGQHFFLIVNTNAIISKKIDGVLEGEKAVQVAFQNLKLSEFYYEVYSSNSHTFVSICRKDVVDDLLQHYKDCNLNPVGFSLGSLSSSQLEQVIQDAEITTSNSVITYEQGAINNIAFNTPQNTIEYAINGLQVSNASVLPLAGILAYFTNHQKTHSNFGALSKQLLEDFGMQRFFNVGLKVALGSIFALLLVSFLFFSSYSSKIERLNASMLVNQSQKESLLKLSDEVAKKEKLLQDYFTGSSKASWYLDQIGQTVPATIALSELHWQPLAKTIKEDEPILFEQQSIVVKGEDGNNSSLSAWVQQLERLEWVENVAIVNYGLNRQNKNLFEVNIRFKV